MILFVAMREQENGRKVFYLSFFVLFPFYGDIMESSEKDTKTVINIGWDNLGGEIMKRFSAFAQKGYILTEMNDKFFIFTKDKPQILEFMLYKGQADGRELKRLTENGYRLLCSSGEYHMLAASAENAAKVRESTQRKKYILTIVVSAVLLAAVITGIPSGGGFLSSLRSVLAAVFSCTFVFAAARLLRKKKTDDGGSEEDK